MVGTITPLVKVARKTWLAVMTLFMSASVAAAAALGFALGRIGLGAREYVSVLGLGPIRQGLFLVVLLIAVAHQLGRVRIPLPEMRRSVSRAWWLKRDRRLAALVYGSALGFGLLTHIRFATYFVVLCWIALFGGPETGAIVLGVYGLARAMTIAATGLPIRHAPDPWERTVNLRSSIVSKMVVVDRVNAVALLLVSAAWLTGIVLTAVAAG